jgi:peptidoglycan/xylan/chitin deacetylase (PgdA/CDA1 family)
MIPRITKALLSRGSKARLSILIYHRVRPAPDEMFPGEVDTETFDWQMRCLRTYFNVLPLGTAVAMLQAGKLPPGAAAITFDDGYRDNYEVALPILQRHGLCATFFIATGFLGDGIMFNDVVIESFRRATSAELDLREIGLGVYPLISSTQRRAAVEETLPKLKYVERRARAERVDRLAQIAGVNVPRELMMTEEQVRQLHRAGMEIGAHTVNHPILTALHVDDGRAEIEASREALSAITGAPVTLFAYPNGRPGVDYSAEHVEIVRQLGFSAAVSTAHGIASSDLDVFQLPRFTPWDRTPAKFVARLIRNSFNTEIESV